MNFLKKSYIQRALREEAKGRYKQAAAFYSKAEDFEKVGEMHELLGNLADTFSAKIRAYKQALRWYAAPEHRETLARKLAQTMEAEIQADAKITAIEKQRLPAIAEYYAIAKQWKTAGNIYEQLGMYEKATEMYIQGGEVEEIEKISLRKEAHDHRSDSAQQNYEDAQNAYLCGHRDKAHHLLKQCLAMAPEHAQARALCEKLERAFSSTGSLRIHLVGEDREYLLFGKSVISLGRQEDNDIVLSQHDVSRHHARIGFHGENCLLEDLRSSNGTRINGLRLQKSASIHDRDVLGIGLNVRYDITLLRYASGTTLRLRRADRQREYLLFSGEMYIGRGAECALPLQHLLCDAPECAFKITHRAPYWSVHLHPRVSGVELNGQPVERYVVTLPGDSLRFAGATLLFE